MRVLAALTGSPPAFFAPDNFTFGTPLDRSPLEAAIQQVAGVRAVEDITFRRRGVLDWAELPATLPARPQRGHPGRERPVAPRPRLDPTHRGGRGMTSDDANCPCDVFVHPEPLAIDAGLTTIPRQIADVPRVPPGDAGRHPDRSRRWRTGGPAATRTSA